MNGGSFALNTQTDAISAKPFFINLHFHRDTVSACSCQLDKFSFFANFRLKMFLERFFHHKLNFKFALLKTHKKKKTGEKSRTGVFKNLSHSCRLEVNMPKGIFPLLLKENNKHSNIQCKPANGKLMKI